MQRQNGTIADELHPILLSPFPAKIFKEDREEYILSLRQCQDEESNQPFLAFMVGQLKKSLSLEIERSTFHRREGLALCFEIRIMPLVFIS